MSSGKILNTKLLFLLVCEWDYLPSREQLARGIRQCMNGLMWYIVVRRQERRLCVCLIYFSIFKPKQTSLLWDAYIITLYAFIIIELHLQHHTLFSLSAFLVTKNAGHYRNVHEVVFLTLSDRGSPLDKQQLQTDVIAKHVLHVGQIWKQIMTGICLQ